MSYILVQEPGREAQAEYLKSDWRKGLRSQRDVYPSREKRSDFTAMSWSGAVQLGEV
jgi:hypothetical protein